MSNMPLPIALFFALLLGLPLLGIGCHLLGVGRAGRRIINAICAALCATSLAYVGARWWAGEPADWVVWIWAMFGAFAAAMTFVKRETA